MKNSLLISLSILGLMGCGSGSKHHTPPEMTNQLKLIASFSEDDEAQLINDDLALESDIKAIFKGEDSEPVASELEDSIQDVIRRAEGSK